MGSCSRLLCTAVIRPMVLYRVQTWDMASGSGTLVECTLIPLDDVQNKGFQIMLGTYKRTLQALLATETEVELIITYAETVKHALKTESDDIICHISQTLNDVWNASSMQA